MRKSVSTLRTSFGSSYISIEWFKNVTNVYFLTEDSPTWNSLTNRDPVCDYETKRVADVDTSPQ